MVDVKEKLKEAGFEGFISVEDLKEDFNKGRVPKDEGVYKILRLSSTPPTFLQKGTGGYFKDKDPNVSIDELRSNWVVDEPVIYIGKASELYKRIRQYMQFGSGKAIGHFGGRYIWQLADSDELIVCWKRVSESRSLEAAMIAEFKNCHNGKRPFANIKD